MEDGFYHFEDEFAIRRHLGRREPVCLSIYDRAWEILEAADRREEKIIDLVEPQTGNPDWERDNRKARLTAAAAVMDCRAVKDARKLADRARDVGDFRSYAKAVAARIETETAVWHEAYAKAMPKRWRAE